MYHINTYHIVTLTCLISYHILHHIIYDVLKSVIGPTFELIVQFFGFGKRNQKNGLSPK